ncbi:inc metabolism membrane protein [Thecaphora frezii]
MAQRPPIFASHTSPTLPSRAFSPSSSSSSPLSTSLDGPFEQPTRPFSVRRRLRRASQPQLSSRSALRIRATGVDAFDRTRGFYSSTSADSSSAEESDDEPCAGDTLRRRLPSHDRRSLDYLDLSPSLPYSIASLRTQLLSYLSDLEARARSYYANACNAESAPPGSPLADGQARRATAPCSHRRTESQMAPFYAQLEALKDDLRRLASHLPSPSSALPSPPALSSRASAALAARSQSLAQDWERFSSSFSFPAMPSMPLLETDLASILQPLSLQLPAPARSIAAKVQSRFEELQESLSAMALHERLSRLQQEGEQTSLVKRFETSFAEMSAKGRARASSVVTRAGNVVHEAEDRLYQMALDLARNGQALIHYENLPEFWRNNEHILSGYRFIPIANWPALLKSTFQIHNETGNIHTHLWGLVTIIPLFWPSKGLDDQTTPMDRLVQTLYLIAAAKCLTLSVTWHVMAGCSDHKWFGRFACVDYTGIAWLVAASILTTVYNAFYCQPNLALAYSITTLLVGLVGAILPWAPWFNRRENKPIRIAVFLTMCFTALLPFSHAAFQHGSSKTVSFFSPILPSLAFYIGGLVLYAFHLPESLAPGRFDLWGHSHQLWHVGIVAAIVCHYRAALIFHQNRFGFSCALPQDYSVAAGGSGAIDEGFITGILDMFGLSSLLLESSQATTPIDKMFEKAGGMEGIVGLARADAVVLHWRRLIGTLGNGAVGRGWNAMVDWAQSYW